MTRRKGRRKKPTVAKGCVWLVYEDGVAVCARKKASNDLAASLGHEKAYARTLCCKTEFCGFEDRDGRP